MSDRENGYDIFMLSPLCSNSAVVETGTGMEGCQQDSSLLVCERIWMGKSRPLIFMIVVYTLVGKGREWKLWGM